MSKTIHIIGDEGTELYLENTTDVNFEWDFREKIEDVDKFKRELERAGFMTRNLEEFIENYLRSDND